MRRLISINPLREPSLACVGETPGNLATQWSRGTIREQFISKE